MNKKQNTSSNFKHKDDGFSLIIVIWIILLLSTLASGVLRVTSVSRQSTKVLQTELENKLIASSAIELFMNETFNQPEFQNITNEKITVFDTEVDINISYESGKININWDRLPVISAVFAANGIDRQKSIQLASAILDWRDSDDIPLSDGAETESYTTHQYPYIPRNGAFETTGELRNILGMTDNIFSCILPYITVYSIENAENGFVNISRASKQVRSIFIWAYDNNWLNQNWPNPNDIILQSNSNEDSRKSNETITIVVSFKKDNKFNQYKQILRFKNEAVSAEKPYKSLTRLEPVFHDDTNCTSSLS